ncbi:VWA domain-containing protein [Aliikangiella sp. G2MR2-5]|uniref:vWA domain-containing protein n=1 Tax=Aliikangiella sp. G2MR2-5 TaxID=2788943 RepID=UPI0018A8915D|nr:vWA domain-containing protein [Aliikangiella sp. G2MR2-5]
MKTFIIATLLVTSTLLTVLAVSGQAKLLPEKNQLPSIKIEKPKMVKPFKRPVVELVFALDTTGSMSGLINASKEKIWSIASTMAQAQPAPEIRIGLVAYRDRGDEYITKVIPLSSDLDAVYAELLDFRAQGGGDGPESVNEALYKAVHAIQWSQDPTAYKTVFLVGDAPGHHDYADDIPYHQSIKAAQQKGIVINTIQAGGDRQMKNEWQKIAALGQGDTFKVDTTGEAFAVSTPFDEQIAEASRRLDDTRLYYGSAEEQAKAKIRKRHSKKIYAEADASVQARRAKFNLSDSGMASAPGKDLLQALENNEIELDEIDEDELPEAIRVTGNRIMRKEMVEKKLAERKQAKAELEALSEKRQAYIAEQKAKQAKDVVSLDDKLLSTLKKQAEKKGLEYDEENDY